MKTAPRRAKMIAPLNRTKPAIAKMIIPLQRQISDISHRFLLSLFVTIKYDANPPPPNSNMAPIKSITQSTPYPITKAPIKISTNVIIQTVFFFIHTPLKIYILAFRSNSFRLKKIGISSNFAINNSVFTPFDFS